MSSRLSTEQPNAGEDDVLTKAELAEFLDISERTIERWKTERTIPFVLLPQRGSRSKCVFLRSSILQWLKKREKQARNRLFKEAINEEDE